MSDAIFNFALAVSFGGLGILFGRTARKEELPRARRTRFGAIMCYVAAGLLAFAGILSLLA